MATCPQCEQRWSDGATMCPDDGEALVPDDHDDARGGLAPGSMVGEYRVDYLLGSGTFGDVYAGEQPLIGKRVAIKLLARRFSSEPQMVSRFIAEARAVNRIRHRNIIDIFSFGTLPGRRHYFVMELLSGEVLAQALEREGKLEPAEAAPILRGVAEALAAAHRAGIAHRDLKPDNVFIAHEEGGQAYAKLLDFGVAKLLGEQTTTHKTATGAPVGTPSYMSPEQCRGAEMDHRTDIYAFGVLTHRVLTGALPFSAKAAMDLMVQHTSQPPPSMSSVNPSLPRALDAPVLAMLAKDPDDRPATMADAWSALEAAMAREGAFAPALDVSASTLGAVNSSRPASAAPSPRRSRRLAAGLAALGAIAVAAALTASSLHPRALGASEPGASAAGALPPPATPTEPLKGAPNERAQGRAEPPSQSPAGSTPPPAVSASAAPTDADARAPKAAAPADAEARAPKAAAPSTPPPAPSSSAAVKPAALPARVGAAARAAPSASPMAAPPLPARAAPTLGEVDTPDEFR